MAIISNNEVAGTRGEDGGREEGKVGIRKKRKIGRARIK